jgi:WD40 repeat protein
VRLWDAPTGKQLAEYGGFNTSVMTVAFSPDGAYLAAGLRDSTILVWDVRQAARAAGMKAKQLAVEEMARCWADLADRDAGKAHQAIWTLVAAPKAVRAFSP